MMDVDDGDDRDYYFAGTPTWSAYFERLEDIRMLVELGSSVLSNRALFRVRRDAADGLYYLCVDGEDFSNTVFMHARLLVDRFDVAPEVAGRADAPTDFDVVLDCEKLLHAMDTKTVPGATIMIECHAADDKVQVRLSVPDRPMHDVFFLLDTFDSGGEPDVLSDLDFTVRLELDVCQLSDMLKTADKLKATLLRIWVRMVEHEGTKVSLVTFMVKGDHAKRIERFCNRCVDEDDGSTLVRALSTTENVDMMHVFQNVAPMCAGGFSVAKLNWFVKAMKSRIIVGQIGPNAPLLLEHCFGGAAAEVRSYIRYFVASSKADAAA